MIILSVGMPRAGSGWHYNLLHDLVVANGGQNARQIRHRFHLQAVLTEVNCNIGVLSMRRLLMTLLPSLLGNTFVIKAHAAPSPFAKTLLRAGLMKATYIFRDPRDAMLSAFENGQRALEKGKPNAFSSLVDFDSALRFMLDYVRISDAWLNIQEVLHCRYEDLLIQYDREAGHLLEFLEMDKNKDDLQQVIQQYRPEKASTDQKGIHFSKGKIGRFRQMWSDSQQASLNQAFAGYLERQGYL